MSTRDGLPDWVDARARRAGPPDREIRFRAAAKAIAESILRNRPSKGAPDCPVVVEGIKDERALRVLGFSGTIEKVNRGWDRSRLVAYLHGCTCATSSHFYGETAYGRWSTKMAGCWRECACAC